MSAAVALVGRPNVGKSTLFNKLTRRRDALVADVPGLTRDRRYGEWRDAEHEITLIDTGGLFGDHELAEVLTEHTLQAVREADLVLFMLDALDGITAADQEILAFLRRRNVRFVCAVNKADGVPEAQIMADFAPLGIAPLPIISAAHNRGLNALQEFLLDELRGMGVDLAAYPRAAVQAIRTAVVGRPNVGKSTLINRMLGEERQVVYDMPGTTKDAIEVPYERDGIDYLLIDTAGVRRKGRVDEVTEKFSVVKALEAMRRSHVVILVLDAREGVVEQDLHVLQLAVAAGCGLVIALNKWDGLGEEQRAHALATVRRRLEFVPWVPVHRISARHGTGVGDLFKTINRVHAAGAFEVPTSILTRLVRNLVAAHPAPAVRGRGIKIKVATRAGEHPPRVALHGNQLQALPASYRRYLENGMREALDLVGNPVVIEFRGAPNPYAGKKNELSARQAARRGRMIKRRKETAKRKKTRR